MQAFDASLSPQREKFLSEQSRKFLFCVGEPMVIGTTTGVDDIEREGTRLAESVARRDKGHLKQRQGAEQLGISERGFRKQLKRFGQKKDGAVVHGLRGRRSNRR